jgi:hypothetical protein
MVRWRTAAAVLRHGAPDGRSIRIERLRQRPVHPNARSTDCARRCIYSERKCRSSRRPTALCRMCQGDECAPRCRRRGDSAGQDHKGNHSRRQSRPRKIGRTQTCRVTDLPWRRWHLVAGAAACGPAAHHRCTCRTRRGSANFLGTAPASAHFPPAAIGSNGAAEVHCLLRHCRVLGK